MLEFASGMISGGRQAYHGPSNNGVAALLDAVPHATIVLSASTGEITELNAAWRRFIAENARDEATCVGLGDNYLAACERSQHVWARQLAQDIRALLRNELPAVELLYSCHSPSRLRWLRVHAQRTPNGDQVVLTHTDHTELQIAQARARIQGCVTDTFATRISLVDACRKLALIVCHELAWDHAGVWLPDTASWRLHYETSWTRPELQLQPLEGELQTLQFPEDVELPGRVWSRRKAEWLDEPELPAPLRDAGFRSGFAFAVRYDDDVLAVIDVYGRMRQPADEELLALLEVAGVQLATAELRERAELRANHAQAEADAAREELEALLACVPALVIAIDRTGALRFVNRTAPNTFSQVSESWQRYVPSTVLPGLQRALDIVWSGGPPQIQDATSTARDGKTTWFTHYLGPIRRGSEITGALIVCMDVTQVKQAQQELSNAQRLAAIGTLAAGVAHEINTPIQFVGDSISFLREAQRDLDELLARLLELRSAAAGSSAEPALRPMIAATHAAEEQADLEYLVVHVPQAFERCVEGLERVTSVVTSMKEFSHPAQNEMAPVDLNRAIMATLTVARNEYKYVADLVTDLAELPPVTCHINEINQVVLNIVVNAAHAIADAVANREHKGVITVRTRVEDATVVISIQDTGGGIRDEFCERIFDPFFTTKEVGRGTGQGLAIAWTAVKEKHGGDLTFATQLGVGTTFFIRLPIAGRTVGSGGVT